MDVTEDIKKYKKSVSYALSKFDYSVREKLYMLNSDMNLKIRPSTFGYNNKILISEGFSLGKNDGVNASLVKPEEKKTKKTQLQFKSH